MMKHKTQIPKLMTAVFLMAGLNFSGLNFVSQSASAQTLTAPEVYGGLGANFTENNKSNTSLKSINARLGAKLTPHIGIEGELTTGINSDSNSLGRTKLTSKSAAYAVGFLPVTERIDLIGRLGLSDTDLKTKSGLSNKEQGSAYDVGIGAQIHFDDKNALRTDYVRSKFREGRGDADNLSLSYVRKF
jgi:outer membrane immunogenic protein